MGWSDGKASVASPGDSGLSDGAASAAAPNRPSPFFPPTPGLAIPSSAVIHAGLRHVIPLQRPHLAPFSSCETLEI